MKDIIFDLNPLTRQDVPTGNSAEEWAAWLDAYFAAGEKLMMSMPEWTKGPLKCDGVVQIWNLNAAPIKKQFNIKDYWCGRISVHSNESIKVFTQPHEQQQSNLNPVNVVKSLGRRLSKQAEPNGVIDDNRSEVERQAEVMSTHPSGLYERFRRGLLEYHSENEAGYIETLREVKCLQVFLPHVAEVWRSTYVTPPPTNPRTFIILLLSRELKSSPTGARRFLNISLPFDHPDCPPKVGDEKSRVRGRYVAVELVQELNGGREVEWRMATSSDAGGNIPRFMTNSSLPNSITEDVPAFIKWMDKRFPEGEGAEPAAFRDGQTKAVLDPTSVDL